MFIWYPWHYTYLILDFINTLFNFFHILLLSNQLIIIRALASSATLDWTLIKLAKSTRGTLALLLTCLFRNRLVTDRLFSLKSFIEAHTSDLISGGCGFISKVVLLLLWLVCYAHLYIADCVFCIIYLKNYYYYYYDLLTTILLKN